METLFTAFRPSPLHLGNVCAMRQTALRSRDRDTMIMVADYHALAALPPPGSLKQRSLDVAKACIAVGVDPERVILFRQSDVPEHMELLWILCCAAGGSELTNAGGKGDQNLASAIYPILMAADILLYQPDVFLVGPDQEANIERVRRSTEAFNRRFGSAFKSPEGEVLRGIVLNTSGKPYGHNIRLLSNKDGVAADVKAVLSGESPDILRDAFNLHCTVRREDDIKSIYDKLGGVTIQLQESITNDIEAALEPIRREMEAMSDESVGSILGFGCDRARARASAKLTDLKRQIGIGMHA
jgi:tryptophanyl-tRNA synthetase